MSMQDPETTVTDDAGQLAVPQSRLPSIANAPPLRLNGEDLRHVILDYLTTSTCVDTAAAFVRQWHTSGNGYPSSDAPVASGSGSTLANGYRSAVASSKLSADSAMDTAERTVDHSPSNGYPQLQLDGGEHVQSGPSETDDDASYTSPLLTREEVRSMRIRKDIRHLVEQGSIQSAVDMCNLHFPSVLASSADYSAPSSHNKTQTQQASASAAYSNSSTPRHAYVPQVKSHSANSHKSRTPTPPIFSTNPLRLALSLQIQLFIEVVRQAACSVNGSSVQSTSSGLHPSRPSTPFSAAQSPGSAHGSMEGSTASIGSTASSAMSFSSSASVNGTTSALSGALAHAQSLYAQADRLADPVLRQTHRAELESVSGLLPYHDPRLSPVSYYLDENRRLALAEAVSGAILLSLGKSSTRSKLEQVLRQNDTVWRSLHDLKATYPQERGASKNKPPKPIVPFDMQEFVDTAILPGA